MFRKLKDKIAAEIAESPQRFQEAIAIAQVSEKMKKRKKIEEC